MDIATLYILALATLLSFGYSYKVGLDNRAYNIREVERCQDGYFKYLIIKGNGTCQGETHE